jgi:tetratricopeptide (TPR) repeat protein
MRTWGDWDWEGAETAFRRAIELDPNFADVRAYYSHFLMIMQRPDEAIRQMESALELDPYSALVNLLYGMVLESSHRFDEAIDLYRNILRTVPNHPLALGGLVECFYSQGMYNESFEAAKANNTRGNPGGVEALEQGWAEGGFKGAMTRRAEWWVANYPGTLAGVSNYIMAGKNQEALDRLELGFEAHNPNMPYLSVLPIYDSLRNEPRFKDLLRRMNLPE